MWIEPSTLSFNTTTTPVGSRFNITVYANISVPSYAWQYFIVYNAEHLKNATGTWYSAGSKSEWAGTNPTSPLSTKYGVYNATHDWICLGESLQGSSEVPAGSYSLAIIEFEIGSAPPEGEIYESQISLDIIGDFNSYVLDLDLNEIPLNFGNAAYSYESVPQPLPNPSIKVSPEYFVSSSLGQTFSINVTMEDLEAEWNLTSVEFDLQYNGSFIEAIGVTEGSFLSQFGDTNFTYAMSTNSVNVNITLESPTESPYGTGTLATISFNVTSRPPATSALVLENVLLSDVEGNEIPSNIFNGYYEMYEYLTHEITVDSLTFYVTTLSNGSISPVEFNITGCLLEFNITGVSGTTGFVNITIPNELLSAEEDAWVVTVDGEQVEAAVTVIDENHTMLSFSVPFSTKLVQVIGTNTISEYSPLILIILLSVITLPVSAIKLHLKRKRF
jgi:hypothetical protein